MLCQGRPEPVRGSHELCSPSLARGKKQTQHFLRHRGDVAVSVLNGAGTKHRRLLRNRTGGLLQHTWQSKLCGREPAPMENCLQPEQRRGGEAEFPFTLGEKIHVLSTGRRPFSAYSRQSCFPRRNKQPAARARFLALGTPIGTHEFVDAAAEARLGEAQRLLDEIAELPDLQSSWCLQLQCASPRANHLIRTLPPSLSAGHARDHDAAFWRTLQQRLGPPCDDEAERGRARQLAFLRERLGGLGLSSAFRFRPAANWAAWADALPVLHQRRPDVAVRCVRERLFG